MNRDKAIKTINFDAWIEKDFEKFAKVVHEEAVVRDWCPF